MKIAVCIPVWRPPAWYELATLESVKHAAEVATRAGHRVTLMIGADGCAEALARTLAAGFDCYWSSENRGASVMRNSLYELAFSAGYDAVAYWDCDDWMHPEHLSSHASLLQTGRVTSSPRQVLEPGRQRVERSGLGRGLISAGAWRAVGGFRSDLRYDEDTEWATRAVRACGPLIFTERVTWRYTRGPDSLMRNQTPEDRDSARALVARLAASVYIEPETTPLTLHRAERVAFEYRDSWPYGDEAMPKPLEEWTFTALIREAERLGAAVPPLIRKSGLLPIVRRAQQAEAMRLAQSEPEPFPLDAPVELEPAPSVCAVEDEVTVCGLDPSKLTRAELKAELDKLGAEYGSRDNKARLIRLLEGAL